MRHIARSSIAALTSLTLALHIPFFPTTAGAGVTNAAAFPPAQSDEAARRCDTFAAPGADRQYTGPREPITSANRDEALRVCQQAASARPVRPRYTYELGVVLWHAQRHEEAMRYFTAAHDAGNPWGAFGLGLAYAEGIPVARDGAAALRLFREAHAAGVPTDAHIGWLYENGVGVPADVSLAATWYRSGADAGLVAGTTGLMRLAFGAKPMNIAEGVALARKAAEDESAEAQLALGWCYLTGSGVPKDDALSAQWYEKAARQGVSEAMYRLGLAYWQGRGVSRSLPAAAQWLHAAAQRGHAWAQVDYAHMLYYGWGTPRDPRTAFAWAMESAKAGVVPAQVLVAAMYDDGDGAPRDHGQSVRWFRQAATNGDVFAMWQLGWHLRNGDGTPRNESEAVQWFRKGAERGHADSEAALGEGYMNGLGGPPDYRAAAYWLERAANKGNGAGQVNLGVLYANGWGVPRDPQRARALFLQASHSPDPRYARAARENLGQARERPGQSSLSRSSRSGSGDGGAIVGAALVGLVLLAVLGGAGGGSSDGGGGGMPTSGSGWPSGGGAGGVSSSLGAMQSPRPMASPMSGNTTQILHGTAALGGTVNRR